MGKRAWPTLLPSAGPRRKLSVAVTMGAPIFRVTGVPLDVARHFIRMRPEMDLCVLAMIHTVLTSDQVMSRRKEELHLLCHNEIKWQNRLLSDVNE